MRRFKRRSDRPDPARRRPVASLEVLESRQLLAQATQIAYYQPQALIHPRISHESPPLFDTHPIAPFSDRELARLGSEGRVITGKNRLGDEYIIEVHGPGTAIVTDVTPNDGILNDDIETIQLIGTSPKDTFVTGQVVGSARAVTSSTVFFNHLVAENGVHSIILNGFTLARTVAQTPNAGPEIFLPGGVGYLQFHDIDAALNQATNASPFNIVIGDPTTPLTTAPVIRLDSIFNTVFNSNTGGVPSGVLQTTPTVNILVNGELHGLEIVSSTAAPVPDAGRQLIFTPVLTTGRTSVQAQGVDHLKVDGSARNFTAARTPVPFQHGFSGLDHLGTAEFGGNADAVGLDVNGRVQYLRFLRGLGNPAGTSLAATSFGTPASDFGYPHFGFYGGLVRANQIDHIAAGPADVIRQTASDPDLIQNRRQGSTNYFIRPGTTLTNAAIVSTGSIGRTTIVGNTQTSEIRSGFHYPSFIAGLEPTREPSRIGPLRQRGDVVDSIVAASYRPGADRTFGTADDVPGRGTIRGHLNGVTYGVGRITPLADRGTGFFAQKKQGHLPPPEGPRRIHSVLIR